MTPFEERVHAAVRSLRPGDLATYGEIAEEAGSPGAAQAVGNVLRASDDLPWWRVIRADGRVAPPKPDEAARRLAAEGVQVRGGRVVASPRTLPAIRRRLSRHDLKSYWRAAGRFDSSGECEPTFSRL